PCGTNAYHRKGQPPRNLLESLRIYERENGTEKALHTGSTSHSFSKHFIANANYNHAYYKLRTVAQQRYKIGPLWGNSSTSINFDAEALCTSLQWLTNSLKWGILPLASPLQVLHDNQPKGTRTCISITPNKPFTILSVT
ncbi:unnamed protein product, partial [Musa textilis]